MCKEFYAELWKTILNKFAKSKSREVEYNLLKMKKDNCKYVQENLNLAIGYHYIQNEVCHWGFPQ